MTIDMTKAVKGATVHFRCGGSAVVDRVVVDEYYNGLGKRHHVLFDDTNLSHAVIGDGKVTKDFTSIFDIIRIDPPAFDWSTVKAGMAFRNNESGITHIFLCKAINGMHVMENTRNGDIHRYSLLDGWFTRTPEHDIEVAE